jgi:hypothetical protein
LPWYSLRLSHSFNISNTFLPVEQKTRKREEMPERDNPDHPRLQWLIKKGASLFQLPFSWRVVCLQLVAASAASDKAVDAHTNGTGYIRIQPPPGHWQQTGIRDFSPRQSFSFFLRTSSTSMPSLYAPVLLLLLEVADGRGGRDELIALLTRRRLQAWRSPASCEKRNVVGLPSLGLLQQLSPCQPYSPPPTSGVIRGWIGVVDESLGITAANRHHVSVVELVEPDYASKHEPEDVERKTGT